MRIDRNFDMFVLFDRSAANAYNGPWIPAEPTCPLCRHGLETKYIQQFGEHIIKLMNH